MSHKDTQNMFFLLGGHDLEMLTIRELLTQHNVLFADKHLTWGNALLSSYTDVIETHPDADIYGIELGTDIAPPSNYHLIDHHNQYATRSSSLEQVADVVGVELTSEQILIAANDSGYIPALKQLGASDEVISSIRKKDRLAQGITMAEEETAARDVKQADTTYPGLITVFTSLEHFSPLEDILYDKYPYHSHIIYSDSQLCVYGNLANAFISKYSPKDIYFGGTGRRYAGIPAGKCNAEELSRIATTLKALQPISKHIFILPFKIDKKNIPDSRWVRKPIPENDNDKEVLFNEKQYFYPFVHPALYDNGENGNDKNGNTLVRHYELDNPPESYVICVNGKEYSLNIDAININLYDIHSETGVGILSFHLSNSNPAQSSPEDILKINQYGRRIMPPFFKEITFNTPRVELSDWIALVDKGGQVLVKEDFRSFTADEVWKAGGVISFLTSTMDITPVIDDRMFTMSYYRCSSETERICKQRPQSHDFCRSCLNTGASCEDFWYKYVFVDGGDATCYGEDMYRSLLKSQTYSRWEHPYWGSEYGVSRYSMVLLTTDTAPLFLTDYFESIYARLVELVLLQRTAILTFSGKVRALSMEGISSATLYRSKSLTTDYSLFVNHFLFREVTSQDQGIELYSLLKNTLNLDDYEKTLREQIYLLHNQVKETYDSEIQTQSHKLNVLAGIIVPFSVFASLAGLWQLMCGGFQWWGVLIFCAAVVILGAAGAWLVVNKFIANNHNK